MNKQQFKKSFLAAMIILLCMVACRKESLESRTYSFVYYYKNYCGGEIRVSVPNSFSPHVKSFRVYTGAWQFMLSGYWSYGNDSCERAIPIQWRLKGYIKSVEMRVVNKQQQMVYYTDEDTSFTSEKGWDGNLMNSSTPAPAGQYYWKLRIVDLDDVVHEEQGTVYLVR